MARWLRLVLPGLLFSLMLVFAGANAYQSLASLRSTPGWSVVEQRGQRLLIVQVRTQEQALPLQVGDEVITLNGQDLKYGYQIEGGLFREEPGSAYTIAVRRDGRLLNFTRIVTAA